MKILLIVGAANDVFIVSMTKWLKQSMPDVQIDIFEFYSTDKQEKNIYADSVTSVPKVWLNKLRGLRGVFMPIYESRCLKKFLDGKMYDVIQCHWIVPPLILTRGIHRSCHKLFATFWGREWANFKVFYSNELNKYFQKAFLRDVDCLLNARPLIESVQHIYPDVPLKYRCANLGAAALDSLYQIMHKESKNESKEKLHIPSNKTTVLLGYSGKPLHQHLKIIQELNRISELKEKIHLLAPMTRGASAAYIQQVETALANSGYSYTLLKNRFLSNEEVSRLRHATDITLQLSTTDAFSRSIIECFCARSVVIYGDWLCYENYLKKENLVAHAVTSISEGVECLQHILNHFPEYEEESFKNSINALKDNQWSECINDWVNAYRDVLNA